MFYIFHGDDPHSQKEQLNALLSKMGDASMLDLNTTRLEGIIPLAELRNACDSMPFLAQVRVVLITDLFTSRPDKSYVDDLLDYLSELPDTTRLFFLESSALPGNHRALKFAEHQEGGGARLFARPKGQDLNRWISQRVTQRGGQISSGAVQTLARNVGSDLYILDNEIEKLLMYKGTEEQIEAEDVGLLSPYAAEANIFELVDALGNRDEKRASLLLHQKLREGMDHFHLFSMIARQFRLLIQVKEMADVGARPPTIGRQLQLHSFVAGKLFQQSQRFTLPQLERIHRHLLEVDLGVKTGRNDMVTALSLLVAGVTGAN